MKKAIYLLLCITIFAACNKNVEQQYLDFLYDNMSLPDSIDYPQSYYAEQIAIALRARAEMPWGKDIPEREFRHFVLPVRVNNEDLDDFRTIYYEELAERVSQRSMEDAILEVNHWCHEHVTYRPTSARTLGPASTIRTAFGRCGEESVLLVAALRTVGIPARQVYTPRWAHTDDNHAWVEAWANGKWHFLGACEPEPVLDLGWFNESASRGMLMHTKVFGRYNGPEDIVKQEECLTEINVTANYAPTRKVTITIVDSNGQPVENANIAFKIYNYAEFFTVATSRTDRNGQCSLTAGLGDLLVWASKDDKIAYKKINFNKDPQVTLTLSKQDEIMADLYKGLPIDIVPPSQSVKLPVVSDSLRQHNNIRLAYEDSIRHAYEATMPNQRFRGNYRVIQEFVDSASKIGLEDVASKLIEVLPDKDLHDVTLDVLLDNLQHQNTLGFDYHTDNVRQYLLSPRIENERLTPFKALLGKTFKGMTAKEIVQWVNDSITLVEKRNPLRLRSTPIGVYKSKKSDELGRNIFFVAACRSAGIIARINEINGKVQYTDMTKQWVDVDFDATNTSRHGHISIKKGLLKLNYQPDSYVPDAKYYTHFTLSRIDNGKMTLLTFPEEATFQNTFAKGVELDAGSYVLTTGSRMADGSVLASMQAFTINAGTATELPFSLRKSEDKISVKGSLNAEDLYQPLFVTGSHLDAQAHGQEAAPTSLLATCGRGYYILGIVAPNHEPSNHILRDLATVGNGLESWGRKIVLLFENKEMARRFNASEFKNLPSTITWGADIDGMIYKEVVEQMHLNSAALPIILICDSFNRVVYVQQGYTIGIGEQLLKVIHQL